MSIFSFVFIKAAAERAVRAAAASGLSVLVVGDGILNALNADWATFGGVAAGGAVVSLLLSIAGNTVSGDGPAFGHSETLT